MTRRTAIVLACGGGEAAARAATLQAPPAIPVHLVLDKLRHPWANREAAFWDHVWPEAVRALSRGGVKLEITVGPGEVGKPPGRQPVILGLRREALNVVVTDQLPMEWDNGRSVNGATLIYRGYHVCLVALNWAHGNQLPILSVNTCLHELLHALLLDIFEARPKGWLGQAREVRVDAIATRLWLFGDGSAVRAPAREYLARMRRSVREFFG